MKIAGSGVQVKKFLRSPHPFKAFLASFLISCRSMRLFNQIVAPGRGNHLTVRCTVKLRQLSNRRSIAAQFIRVDRGWHFICAQECGEERLGCLSVAVFLKKHVQHSAMLINGPP